MIATLFGSLFGGLFRLTPEVLKWMDRSSERRHELAMQEKALAFERLRGPQKMAEIRASSQAHDLDLAIPAWLKVNAQQDTPGANRFTDRLSRSVRPTLTYSVMGLYGFAKAGQILHALLLPATMHQPLHVWNDADQALLAGVLHFWFLGRVFDRGSR